MSQSSTTTEATSDLLQRVDRLEEAVTNLQLLVVALMAETVVESLDVEFIPCSDTEH